MAGHILDNVSSSAVESLAVQVKAKHNLTSFHIFDERGGWRVFGNHRDPKGYTASVDEGFGVTICDALRDLDARLVAGPHRAAKPGAETPSFDSVAELAREIGGGK